MIAYRGWTITHSIFRPVTGAWRAERFGVGMGAATKEALQSMIDAKINDETRRWLKTR